MRKVFAKWVGSGFPSEKGWDGGINGKKWAGKWDLRSLLGTLYELYEKSGFLEQQLSHKTKNSSSEIILPSYASNSISLVSRKGIFTGFFSSFRGRFRMGCRRKKTSLLKFGFWRERRRPLTQARSFVDVAVARETSGA